MTMKSAIQELQEQRRLLEMEYNEEKRSFREISDRIGIERLVARGAAWFPVTAGRSRYNSLNQKVLEITVCQSVETDHSFEYGRPVNFVVSDSSKPGGVSYGGTGTVSYVNGDRMVVALNDDSIFETIRKGTEFGVILGFDETTYAAMFDALSYVAASKGRLGELRDLFYSRRKVAEMDFAPLGFPYLNTSQEKGVNSVLRARDVAVVHGPPGTGKTTTLVEAIFETLRRESQVLVCAQSNMAVDWISEKLTDRGINVLRIGNPSRVNDKMLGFTYERRFEAHTLYPELWSVRRALRELGRHGRGDGVRRRRERLKSRAAELEIAINGDVFGEARVIASTLVGSASHLLDGMQFSTLFIDEAAQALEAACWIPLRKVKRVVLAGDHCQLPATVKSYEAMRQGLGKSLMERIVENHPECVTLLTMQYRMHENIMRYPNEWFYGGKMTAAPEVRNRGILDFDTPLEWVDTAGSTLDDELKSSVESVVNRHGEDIDMSFTEDVAKYGFGRLNRDEGLLTAGVLKAYLEKIGKQRILDERIDIGVISPYRAQVHYLRHLISRVPFFRPYRQLISVNTIDGFQGQERDVILISMVRCNDNGDIGFLRELRRMNVAMTRARMKLIIIGDSATLSAHGFYKGLYRFITERDDADTLLFQL